MSELSLRALEIAQTQVGQHEDELGSNWGHPVIDYLASVGINFPASWCMAFLYWCVDHAAKQFEEDVPIYRTGGVMSQWNHAKNKLSPLTVPSPGDIFIMDYGKGLGHTGIVEKADPDGTLHTIEGNSNNNGSRQGDTVVRHTRKMSDPKMKGYISF